MKKTFFTLCVLTAVLCCTLAFATTGQGRRMKVATAIPSATSSDDVETAKYGVSIGTVEAQDYSDSGLSLEYFNYAAYVARTSDDTYMGFNVDSDWIEDEATGESVREYFCYLVAVNSTEEAITVPDSIKIDDAIYPVRNINYVRGITATTKILTVPATIKYISSGSFNNLEAMYMLGEAPNSDYDPLSVKKVYVCDKSCFSNYVDSEAFFYSSLLPYGWDIEWITVNVEKNGEFAETYLTQNNYDWTAGYYVKITGNINDIDLNAIKNLTCIMKLDLSETTITRLPQRFMANRYGLQEIKLPVTLTEIGPRAFSNCSRLKSFDLNGISNIAYEVFNGCSSLNDIDLNGVESIGESAFAYCTSLENIDLSTVIYIYSGAFNHCESIKSLNLASAIRIYGGSTYSKGAFAYCTSLENIIFGSNLTIGKYTFYRTGLKKIIIPEGVSSIEEGTFYNCESLYSVTFPASLQSIGERSFYNCSTLTEVNMKTGITTIGNTAFYGCTSLEDITIPATVKTIGYDAFSNTGVKNFRCYAVVPPIASSSFIGGGDMDMSRTYLYVPPFSKDFYRNTEYWSDFYLMRSIDDQIDYILVDRPLTINLEEEDNDVVANNPEIALSWYEGYRDYEYYTNIGQLTAIGEGTLSAGQLTIDAILSNRERSYYDSDQCCPTLINYADKMRADNVSHSIRFTAGNGNWHFISLPYDVKVGDIVPSEDTYWVIRRYDSAARAAGETSETWVNMTNDEIMEAGKGYIISATGGVKEDSYPRLTFTSGNSLTKNNIFRSNDVTVQLTEYPAEFAHNRSWNLIGNPYPCYFDMHCLNEEFTAPVTIWNGYYYAAYSPVDDDLVLSPYEAFFVQCPLELNSITFKENGRMHSDEGKELYKSPAMNAPVISAEERNVFNFEIANETCTDRARIVLNPEASMQYEIGRDAAKFFAEDNNGSQIYIASDVNYSIDERPVADGTAMLGLRVAKEEECTLSLNGRFSREWQVLVTDNVTGITVDLTQQDYQFTVSSETSGNRFSVMFRLAGNSSIDSIMADFGKDAIVTVCTLNGMSVYTGVLSGISVPDAGLYIISNGRESRKTILK